MLRRGSLDRGNLPGGRGVPRQRTYAQEHAAVSILFADVVRSGFFLAGPRQDWVCLAKH